MFWSDELGGFFDLVVFVVYIYVHVHTDVVTLVDGVYVVVYLFRIHMSCCSFYVIHLVVLSRYPKSVHTTLDIDRTCAFSSIEASGNVVVSSSSNPHAHLLRIWTLSSIPFHYPPMQKVRK